MNISTKISFLLLLLFPFYIAEAQNNYMILSSTLGYVFSNKVNGNFSESFPYSSKDISTGITTHENFNGSLQNPFASNLFVIDLFNVEVLSNHHSINAGFGINTDVGNNYSGNFMGGYSFLFPVSRFLFFKPGLDIVYMWGYDETMGMIDNKNKIIDLLGHEASNQFTIPASKYSPAKTYDADQLQINYHRVHFIACPKVALTNRPGKRFYCGVEAGWYLPLIQTDTLRPQQVAADSNRDGRVLTSLGINDQGAVATLNNTSITKSPSFGGLYIGTKVGWYVKTKKKLMSHA